MIGEKIMQEPKTVGEAWDILKQFGISRNNDNSEFFNDAKRLVELNNEVYTQLHSRSFIQEKLYNIIDAEKQELLEQMNNVRK